ncbi:MAG: triphosphoribosyl-dephospho-CoA synthase [Acholeplasmataceae bacterium]
MNILLAREERRENIAKFLAEYNVVVSLKTNVPGDNKNLPECMRAMYVMNKELVKRLPFHKSESFKSKDGDYILYKLAFDDATHIKEITIDLEESHPLGRYVDIDVYTGSNSISRKDLGYKPRQCVICDNSAFVCMQSNAHTVDEVIGRLRHSMKHFFEDVLTISLKKAFKYELDLHPKFGLVTPYSDGSHKDMNYKMMLSSSEVIIPYLVKMYEVGYESKDIDEGFNQVRMIGLDAEKAMLEDSGGVNTYKGAIFLMGVLVYALGYYHQTIMSDPREIVKYISRDILKELEEDPNTFGIEAYQKYNVYTIRHEVYFGLPSVYKSYHFLLKYNELSDKALTMTLIDIISNKNDTVGLKRAKSFPKYFDMVNKIEIIKTYDLDLIEKVSKECISHNISFGGSADVLIGTILVYLLKQASLM